MDPADILPALERLDDAVDLLEDALQPLINNVTDVASKLPLLDKAKFYVLMTYSIESMLFSALRLNGVDAKEHPVFKELARVRQYFDKIKTIEFPPQKPEQSLNKEAAIRFIRSDLADNKEINTKLSEMIAKERAMASLKTSRLGEKRKIAETTPDEKPSKETDSEEESEEESEPEVESLPKRKKSKKEKKDKSGRKEKMSKKDKRNRSKKEKKTKAPVK
ncbi:Sas10/Utp3/C1D family-domain-containing protein [Xylaria bambusicola]|uniref:Sas10/Utp3/C1D family-domain-containing protein n=1 Tax=Xylaria bambusicola TaxID=326684 RepID=UPI00200809CF|nr:Sas10/Utp3/C1D family-domain-containing protein [Xylaria bambusicola]KAI0509155.1 Sas10/Utp3/C1D family-domain-containing protein [Xylaria bambusicola]